jgi:rubrerythrin
MQDQFSDIKYINEFIDEWKYNDEGFKLVDLLVELRNLLSKNLTESLDQNQLSNNALSGIINALIQDEFDAIQAYNDAIVNFESEGRSDLVQVLHDIINEENLHVGQLETLLKQVSGAANSIDKGQAEAEVQLSQDESKEV